MSFWDNNKDSFKAVGKSTVKGIGKGTAALSKAGYRTLKNTNDKNRGIADNSKEDPVANLPPLPPPTTDLNSYPAPPKRNVPILTANRRQMESNSPYTQYPSQQQIQANTPQVGQSSSVPTPYSRPLSQPGMTYTVSTEIPAAGPDIALPARSPAQSPSDLANPPEKPRIPLPDPSSFASPPLHKDRGLSSTSSLTSVTSKSNLPSTKSNEPPKPSKKTNLMDFNINNVGPPPPAPYRPDRVPNTSNNQPLNVSTITNRTDTSINTPPPPPPSRSSNNSPSVRSTPPPPYSSFHSEASEQPPRLPSRNRSSSNNTPPPPPLRSTRSISPTVSDVSSTSSKADTQKAHKKSAPPKPVKKPSFTLANHDEKSPIKEGTSIKPNTVNNGFANVANEMSQRLSERLKLEDNSSNALKTTAPPVIKPKPKIFGSSNSKPNSESTSNKNDAGNIPLIKSKPQNLLSNKTNAGFNQNSVNDISAPDFPKHSPAIVKKKPELLSKPQKLYAQNSVNNTGANDFNSKITQQPELPPKVESSPTPPPPPPPPRNYRTHSSNFEPPVFDLEIATGWFANLKESPTLPRAFQGLNYSTSCSSSSRTSVIGTTVVNSRNISIMFPDLSVISYKISWENNEFKAANVELEKFVPSPLSTLPSKETLLENHQKFSEYVASWCEHKMGQKVGNGECWTLAHDALSKGCGNHAFVSTYKHHGFPILRLRGNGDNDAIIEGAELDQIRRGDILQFDRSVFIDKTTNSTKTIGDPDHTSVVLQNTGDKLIVAEQNVNGQKFVTKSEESLKNLYSGTVVAYRVMPSSWKIDL